MSSTETGEIAIVGGGLIGISWAALFQAFGRDVALFEPDEAARENIAARVSHPVAQVREIVADLPDPGLLRVSGVLEDALRDACWVQENVPENVPLKRDLYASIERLAPPDVTVASSTSSLVWSELSAEMVQPDRLITAHPFNPPHLMPLVELYGRDAKRVAAAADFYRRFHRHPVTLRREAVGHIANRLSSALWREAVNMVAEGIADVSAIDEALVHGPGLRWSVVGAHMAYHLGGGRGGIEHYLAHLGPSQEKRWADLGSPRLDTQTQKLLVAGIEAEAAGRDISTLEASRDEALIAAQIALHAKRP